MNIRRMEATLATLTGAMIRHWLNLLHMIGSCRAVGVISAAWRHLLSYFTTYLPFVIDVVA